MQLKQHQLAMVHAMDAVEERCHDETAAETAADKTTTPKYGVLSAPVGSGKTFCVVALCLRDRYLPPKPAAKRGFWDIFAAMRPGRTVSGATLVVAPSHLMAQWRAAVRDLVGESADSKLRVHCFESYGDVISIHDPRGAGKSLVKSADMFIVSSLYYQPVATALMAENVAFRRLVFDEADSMAPLLQFAAPAAVTWFVSATLEAAVSASAASGSDLAVGSPYRVPAEVLRSNAVDCDVGFVRQCFVLPDLEERPPVLCDDGGGAYAALPSLIDDDKLVRALYACDPSVLLKGLGLGGGSEHDERSMASSVLAGWRVALSEATQHLEDALEKPEKDPEGRIAARSRETIARLSPRVAALCASLDALEPQTQLQSTFSKVQELLRICTRAHETGEKTLVFCEFESRLLTALQSELDRAKVPYATVDGGTAKKMAEAFERYGKGNGVHVLIAHSTMFSCGVNLEMTAHIVLGHRLLPALRTQVVGRAQRPGRTGPLAVTELLYPGE